MNLQLEASSESFLQFILYLQKSLKKEKKKNKKERKLLFKETTLFR